MPINILTHKHKNVIRVGDKVIGYIDIEGGRLIKTVVGSKHMLRSPRAWALDSQSLKDAEIAGATIVELHDGESGKTYSATVELIQRKGIFINRGFGAQIALPLNLWTISEPGAKQLSFQGV